MPKDEFERLERRWRERPLFLEQPRRKPFRVFAVLALTVGVFLAFAAIGPPATDRPFGRLTSARGDTAGAQAAQTIPVQLKTTVSSNDQNDLSR